MKKASQRGSEGLSRPGWKQEIEQLQSLLELMERYHLAELEWEKQTGEKLKFRSLQASQLIAQPSSAMSFVSHSSPGSGKGESDRSTVAEKPASSIESPSRHQKLNSPLVGTFYRSPSPSARPYVEVGQVVQKGQVLCIVEAMKLMNEIEAEISGKIVSILIENGQPVEFGEPLFLIDPSGE